MAAVSLTLDDLTPFAEIDSAKASAMIEDALALAARVAPCITEETFTYEAAAKAILRGAILRWHEAGTGALQSQQAGPYGVTLDTRQQRKGMFWPSEIEDLQGLCREATASTGAFSIIPCGSSGGHLPWCDIMLGATSCSCGYSLTLSYPIYEGGDEY